jgi:hypothetical protein
MHTFVAARTGQPWLQRWHPFLQTLHTVFYTSVTTFPFLVTATYWATMYVGPWFEDDFDRWLALSIHMLNSVFALFEIVFTSSEPPPWTHLGVLLVLLSLYLPIPYITKATEGFFIYLWLDPNNGIPQLIAHVVGYAVVMVFIFNAVKGTIWLRCLLTSSIASTQNNRLSDSLTLANRMSVKSSGSHSAGINTPTEAVERSGNASSLNVAIGANDASGMIPFDRDTPRLPLMEFPVPEATYPAPQSSFRPLEAFQLFPPRNSSMDPVRHALHHSSAMSTQTMV